MSEGSDEQLADSVLVAFFEGCPIVEEVMDGLAECAGYGRLVDMVRDLQTASGFVHVRDMLRALDEAEAALILPSALVSRVAWQKLVTEFWNLLLDERHERHDLSVEQLRHIFDSIESNREGFISHLQWLTSDPQCLALARGSQAQN
jgi:hypothetical protein